ncbi:MAG: DNA mismatch repair endonuclease MutL [Proteobacteria bacterium]|nr:DNA mismatch repair endonuclease MutL [Pseudomonadota bacterium]MCG2824784.1 DNA mismatch repair endonuclease MutL [Desulfobulbaceae bacterium]MDP2756662.1 DNA mismatch repair endonuclease MutL [Desulfurivibrionaceae bacterium]PKN16967.1 MAG: DNA mismatch repair protein MutL [Deltaproteobacteria bacterium HGW-Deltaproteobacteria-3]
MSRIRILPENLANQIAAGEVVERPASVVKELLENAIDAGAIQIGIQVEGDGTRLIRVIDDGAGMDQDDVLLCLERHATSKITSLAELGAIRSLGFRGEAVPSIASVSRVRITSRPAAQELGTQVDLRFGKVLKVHEMGGSPGTSFEVTDLFGNVPARKKFLKSTRTELAHIEEVVKNYALVCPELGFSLAVDGREVLRLPSRLDTPRSRAERIFGKGGGALVEVERQAQDEIEPGVWGYLLPPDAPVAGRLRIFVNGRAIHDRLVAHAVNEGLQNYLMKGRGAGGVIFLNLPLASVDVNVHPTKQEVRFHKPSGVHQAVVAAVQAAMADHQQALKKEIFQVPVLGQGREQAKVAPAKAYAPVSAIPAPAAQEPLPLFAVTDVAAPPVLQPAPDKGLFPEGNCAAEQPQPSAAGEEERALALGGLRYLGQVLDTYLLCATENGLLAVDQHAAHERLLFETLKRQFASKKIARQTLLFPKVMECSLEELQILKQYAEDIRALGVEIEDFGGASQVVKAVPAVLGRSPVEEVMAGIFARFGEPGSGKSGVRAEEVLSDMACKAAIKAGQRLTATEAEALLDEMQRAEVFSHCPHGRPVAKSFTSHDIKKWFYRG